MSNSLVEDESWKLSGSENAVTAATGEANAYVYEDSNYRTCQVLKKTLTWKEFQNLS